MDVETPDTAFVAAPERACPNCGSALAPGQDWCLECGTAVGALARSSRPGWRAATTIIATVLLLVGGAVAASYAALNSKAQQFAAAPPPPSATPTVPTPPPATTTATVPAPPPVTTSTPTPPPAPTPPATTSTPAPPPAPTPTTPTPAPKPKPTGPAGVPGYQPLALGVDIASIYDPYKNVVDSTDPSDSYDGKDKTVFTLSTNAGKDMAAGLDFDLGAQKEVGAVYIRTTTPGFTVEVYGAKGKQPPDILDTRWEHLATHKDVAIQPQKKGLQKITFPRGSYRHIVLWFTAPPPSSSDGTSGTTTTTTTTTTPTTTTPAEVTVGIAEVRILD